MWVCARPRWSEGIESEKCLQQHTDKRQHTQSRKQKKKAGDDGSKPDKVTETEGERGRGGGRQWGRMKKERDKERK